MRKKMVKEREKLVRDYTTVSVRMPNDLYDMIVEVADREDRSMSQQFIHFVRGSLKEEGRKNEVQNNQAG